ncbi:MULTISPECIES: matrixin family metalloprotease [Listeria]|uniref:matrixin family metalloprotease n=1 Tax=Listeria TaxID=1637 RepID=UPI0035DF35BF
MLTVVVFGVVVIPGVEAHAKVSINNWDLVDRQKHMDYDGNSKYMSYIRSGAKTWNAYKKGVIRPDTVKIIQDVYCRDTYANNYVNATTYSNGKIIFNKKNMDKKGSSGKKNVAIHELGHCLRLGHNTSSDIMYKYSTNKTTLSTNDKQSYNAAYKKY